MEKTNNKLTQRIFMALTVIFLLGVSFNSWAQVNETKESRSVSITTMEDGKVKLKVITKEGDDSKTFEKTYDSYEDIQGDPDLEKYGVNLGNWSFGGKSGFGALNGAQGFPGMGQGGNNFFMFNFDADSLSDHIQDMMSQGFGNGFNFNFDEEDSLSRQFNFNFGNGRNFFNGEEFEDMQKLQEALRERFSDMDFGFDFSDMGGFGQWNFDNHDQQNGNDDSFRTISRARVFVRSAKESDKEIAGTDKMDDLEIKDISFYPNPSDGKFNLEVQTTNKSPLQIKIVNAEGGVVYNKTDASGASSFNFDIDISNKDEGVYILQVIQNNKALTKRIIVE